MAKILYWGDEKIALPQTADISKLQADIEEAARAGGGWVTVSGASRENAVFVSPGQYIRIGENSGGGRVIAL